MYPSLSQFTGPGYSSNCQFRRKDSTMTEIKDLKPLDDRVAVRPDPAEDRTPGGILLPDQNKARPRRGTVVAVGPGKMIVEGPHAGTRIPVGVRVGDRVQFANWGESSIKEGDEEIFLLRESDIYGVFVNTNEASCPSA